jgi:hypothetical protein
MEKRNRNLLIAIAAVLVVACGCIAIAGATVVAGYSLRAGSPDGPVSVGQERMQQAFEVGDHPYLQLDNFAGNVIVRAGAEGAIHVVATKKASHSKDLARIDLQMLERDGGLIIQASAPRLIRDARVRLEITAPAGTRLDLTNKTGNLEVQGFTNGAKVDTRAGNVILRDVTGDITVINDVGAIEVQGAVGPVRLLNRAGAVAYQGTPRGDCHFESDLGAIVLELPAKPDVGLDLSLGLGEIEVNCPVHGSVSRTEVQGIIGTGAEGSIEATSRLGGIGVACR